LGEKRLLPTNLLGRKGPLMSPREQEVEQVAHKLVQAFGAHDPQRYFSFFSEEASFIFYTHPEVLTSRLQWEQLWAQWEDTLGFRVHSCHSHDGVVQMIGENAAVFRHRVESVIEMEGATDTVWERETIVFERVGESWLAVHEHLSAEVVS